MEKEQRIELYKEAIDKWGEDAQVKMLYEECGELIAAVAQFSRGRTSHHDVMTELADVSIMVEQLATMMNFDDYEKEKDRKLMRLKERLERYGDK
jgi:NTP pyrophosphatase (non-canonical NTP hydrolase)